MKIKKLDMELTVCKVADALQLDLTKEFFFMAKTDEAYELFENKRDGVIKVAVEC